MFSQSVSFIFSKASFKEQIFTFIYIFIYIFYLHIYIFIVCHFNDMQFSFFLLWFLHFKSYLRNFYLMPRSWKLFCFVKRSLIVYNFTFKSKIHWIQQLNVLILCMYKRFICSTWLLIYFGTICWKHYCFPFN